jgi:uncharacterized protein involved in exopolysaccharide biosynthesis
MSSSTAKHGPEIARQLDADRLLAYQIHANQAEIRERRIARVSRLWDQRKLLGKCIAAGAALASLVALLIPSQYASTTRLMPPDSASGAGMAILAGLTGKMGSAVGSLGADLLGMNTSADLFAGVLQSRTVQDQLITKFDLRRVYGESRWVDARKELGRQTDISIDHKSGILTIRVTDHEPKRAAAMAQDYVAQLNDVVTQLNTSSAHRERVFLEARLEQVKGELESAEKDFSQFASKNGAIDIKEQGKAMLEASAMLEGQFVAAQTELQGLRQIYTDQNVRVRAVQARVNELQRQLLKMGGKRETDGSAPSKEDELYPSLRKLPLLGVTYADLYRRMKVEEAICETLTQQFEIAKVQEAKEVPSVKVLDAAEIPEKKSFPPRTLLVLLGALIAFAFGAAWVKVNDRWTNTDPKDPGKVLVLNMAQSVRPQLQYVVQRRNSLFDLANKTADRFRVERSASTSKAKPAVNVLRTEADELGKAGE